MRLQIYNNSVDDFSYCSGVVVASANSVTEVSSDNWFTLFSDTNFLRDIRLNNIQLGDGLKVYSLADAENYMKLITNDLDLNNRDTDGAAIVRLKAAKKGWSFWALPIEITSSTIGGTLYCKDSAGNDIPGLTCKIYDSNNNEITTPGTLNANLNSCVKTVLDYEAAFDYEMIGGVLRINSNPSQDVRLWIVGAPDIPAQYGGSKEFASGVNLKFLAPDSAFEIDGRVAKYITYNAQTHQGKLRIILKHPAGLQLNLQAVIHMYRM